MSGWPPLPVITVISIFAFSELEMTANADMAGNGFEKDHFETTCRVDWAGYPFPVPTRSQELLAEMYSSPSSTEPPRFHLLRSLYRRVKAQLRGIREGAPRYCSKGLPLAPIAKNNITCFRPKVVFAE